MKKGRRVLREEGIRPFLRKSGDLALGNLLYRLRSSFPSMYYPAAEKWYLNRKQFDTDQWDAPLNPYKVVWVSPNSVTKVTSRRPNLPLEQRIEKFGAVKRGDWDVSSDMNFSSWRPEKYGNNKWIYELLIERKFENTTFFKSAEQHFCYDIPWEETEFYRQMLNGFESGRSGWPDWGRNEDELIGMLNEVDELYESVSEKGMKTVQNMGDKSFLEIINSSILVDVARDGEFLFVEGRRRLTVAKLLDIDTIPVRIQIRHTDWMNYRDRVFEKDTGEKHPDFSEFK